MTKYEEALAEGKRLYGEKFDPSGLAAKFVPWFNKGCKIKVNCHIEGVKCGRVGKTTGWRPAFLLVLRSTSTGSSILLSDEDEILAYAQTVHGKRDRHFYTDVPKDTNAPG